MSHETSRLGGESLLSTQGTRAIDTTAEPQSKYIDPDAVTLSFGFPAATALPVEEMTTLTEQVLAADGPAALQYGGGTYAEQLPAELLAQAHDRGIDRSADELTLVNGAAHGIAAVTRALVDPGELVLTEAPTFMSALSIFENRGAELKGLPVDEDGLQTDVLADRLAARQKNGKQLPSLLYTVPTFHNPTGTTLSVPRRHQLLDLAAEYDFMILEDDPYQAIRFTDDVPPSLAALDDQDRVLRLGTVSKTVAPGVRTGWVLGPEQVIDAIAGVDAGGEHYFVRSLLGYYFETVDMDARIAELQSIYQARRDRMLETLAATMPPTVDWTAPAGGFFVWVTLPSSIDAEALLPIAMDAGVAYLPGEMFYPDDRGHNRLRLSFSYASPAAIETGINALATAIQEFESSN